MNLKTLLVSQIVSANSSANDNYTPDNGKTIKITEFKGDAAYVSTAVVKLVWKWNHQSESEDILWSTNGSSELPEVIELKDCDGVRKLAVVCENNSTTTRTMSGFAKIFESDN